MLSIVLRFLISKGKKTLTNSESFFVLFFIENNIFIVVNIETPLLDHNMVAKYIEDF